MAIQGRKRNRRIEGEDDEWITVTWDEKIEGKWERLSHTIPTALGEKRQAERAKRKRESREGQARRRH